MPMVYVVLSDGQAYRVILGSGKLEPIELKFKNKKKSS